ncbi:hypothetical protein [Nocardia concava]|uniref:hypothetical protein n=1 Tax=Nocardia concava TaxID=257281 RepID=UPI00030FB0B9|nr:hypothetical protein [Nocardia concava]
MGRRAITRTAAGAATAIGIGALTLFGTGTAGAEPATLTWNGNGSQYTHTVSDSTPAVGDTITVTTAFYRTQNPDETFNWFKDFHPSCLTYVTDSAKVTDATGTHPVEPYLEIKPDYIAADFTTANLKLVAKAGSTPSPVFSAQYKVGACATGTSLTTGIAFLSTAGASDYSKKGPAITVGGTPGGGTDTGSSGLGSGSSSLTSLFGGLGSSK